VSSTPGPETSRHVLLKLNSLKSQGSVLSGEAPDDPSRRADAEQLPTAARCALLAPRLGERHAPISTGLEDLRRPPEKKKSLLQLPQVEEEEEPSVTLREEETSWPLLSEEEEPLLLLPEEEKALLLLPQD
jgi:hypothetical protein